MRNAVDASGKNINVETLNRFNPDIALNFPETETIHRK
jgi:hypothetical protein